MWEKIKNFILNYLNNSSIKPLFIKAVIFTVAFIIICMFFGCSAKADAKYYPVYKEVNVPVKCSVDIPNLPTFTGNVMEDNINILKYASKLKETLISCVK